MAKKLHIFLCLTIIYASYAMKKPDGTEKIRQPKKLTIIAAKKLKKMFIPENLDETTLDQVYHDIEALYEKIGHDHARHITDEITYEQPLPYFSKLQSKYSENSTESLPQIDHSKQPNPNYFTLEESEHICDFSPALEQVVVYNKDNYDFRVYYKNIVVASWQAQSVHGGVDDVKFLGTKYLAYLKHTRDSLCEELVLNTFEGRTWESLGIFNHNSSIVDFALSSDENKLAIACINKKIFFWQKNTSTQNWKHLDTIELENINTLLEADVYESKTKQLQDKKNKTHFHFKRNNELKEKIICRAVSSIAFLPNKNKPDSPYLLIGLTKKHYKHPKYGILTIWNQTNKGWNLQQLLKDKHDFPIIKIQPSMQGNTFLTHSYSALFRVNYTTLWRQDSENSWEVLTKTRQQHPVSITESFDQSESSFIQYFHNLNPTKKSFIKQFSCETNRKIKKLGSAYLDLNLQCHYSYQHLNVYTQPLIWLDKNRIGVKGMIIHLDCSLQYALCQKALKNLLERRNKILENNATEEPIMHKEFDILFDSKTFSALTQEEKECLFGYVNMSLPN